MQGLKCTIVLFAKKKGSMALQPRVIRGELIIVYGRSIAARCLDDGAENHARLCALGPFYASVRTSLRVCLENELVGEELRQPHNLKPPSVE